MQVLALLLLWISCTLLGGWPLWLRLSMVVLRVCAWCSQMSQHLYQIPITRA